MTGPGSQTLVMDLQTEIIRLRAINAELVEGLREIRLYPSYANQDACSFAKAKQHKNAAWQCAHKLLKKAEG